MSATIGRESRGVNARSAGSEQASRALGNRVMPAARLACASGAEPGFYTATEFQISSRRQRLGLILRLRLGYQQQHDADDREHAEGRVLTVPRLRLPHQEPLAADT